MVLSVFHVATVLRYALSIARGGREAHCAQILCIGYVVLSAIQIMCRIGREALPPPIYNQVFI